MLKPQDVIGLENTPANKTLPRKTPANFASFLKGFYAAVLQSQRI